MNPSHAVVGIWAAGNVGLALGLLAFDPAPFEVLLFIAGAALAAGFGLAVLLAVRTGRDQPQHRQPRRASAGVLAAVGVTVGLLGFAFGWWLSVLAFYPLVLAAWLLRGERLPRGARPWPAALDGVEPASPPRVAQHGSAVGTATAVPVEHPAHGPPTPPRPGSRRLRGAAVLLAAARALADLLRGRRR
jgi:hypothetical protein